MFGDTKPSRVLVRNGIDGLEEVINPAMVTIVGILVHPFVKEASLQGAIVLVVLALAAFRHAILFQGCSACTVPAVYGFLPSACGLPFRNTRSLYMMATLILVLVAIIYTIDLTGNCPSVPIDPSEKATIIADRLIPILASVLGNAFIFCVILRQSQESFLMQTQAAKSARSLADMSRDVLHRVTHELRTPLCGLSGSVELLTVSESLSTEDIWNISSVSTAVSAVVWTFATFATMCCWLRKNPTNYLNYMNNQLRFPSRPALILSLKFLVPQHRPKALNSSWSTAVTLKLSSGASTTSFAEFDKQRPQIYRRRGRHDTSTGIRGAENDMLRCNFRVEDTGIGIDSTETDLLFEPFYQGEQEGVVSRRHQGTGLGIHFFSGIC